MVMPQKYPDTEKRETRWRAWRRSVKNCWRASPGFRVVLIAFLIQTVVHGICFSLYLLQLNHVLPSTRPSLGMPYNISDMQYALFGLLSSATLTGRLISALLFAPNFEELCYRGPVWLSLVATKNRWLGISLIFSMSLLWSLLHGRAFLGTVEVFTAGLLAGWVVLKTKNLFLAITFHFLWNLAVVLKALAGFV